MSLDILLIIMYSLNTILCCLVHGSMRGHWVGWGCGVKQMPGGDFAYECDSDETTLDFSSYFHFLYSFGLKWVFSMSFAHLFIATQWLNKGTHSVLFVNKKQLAGAHLSVTSCLFSVWLVHFGAFSLLSLIMFVFCTYYKYIYIIKWWKRWSTRELVWYCYLRVQIQWFLNGEGLQKMIAVRRGWTFRKKA